MKFVRDMPLTDSEFRRISQIDVIRFLAEPVSPLMTFAEQKYYYENYCLYRFFTNFF